ncbi:MAG: DUF882 domain-containing protein [Vicinamibacterales bacterium]
MSTWSPMPHTTRRRFLSTLAIAAPALALHWPAFAAAPDAGLPAGTRALSFLHTHTGEHLSVEHATGGRYFPDALATIDHFLRDFRTGDVHTIDRRLLDLLHRLHTATGASRPFQVISGYRSPQTNAMLRSRSTGVASHSLHMDGQAIDIRVSDTPLKGLRDAALSLKLGGVGYYPASDFVHVDTGRVRRW